MDWETAVTTMVAPAEVFLPNAENSATYDSVRTVYARLTEFTDKLFEWGKAHHGDCCQHTCTTRCLDSFRFVR